MKKILVAEDDKFLSGAYRIKLKKLGFEVELASDGDDALAHLQTFTPDLILLDLIMPGKDGFTTLMHLRADERWKHIPVIVASNLGQKEDIDKSMALGATDFIVKSDISLEQIANKINALLQTPQLSPHLPTPQISQSPQPLQTQQAPKPSQAAQPSQSRPTPQNPLVTPLQPSQSPQSIQTPQIPQTPNASPDTPRKEGNVR